MITKSAAIGTLSLWALGALSVGCAAQGQDDEVVASAESSPRRMAFQGSDNFLWVDQNGPGTAVNTGLGMLGGTMPSQANLPNGGLELGFQANTNHFFLVELGQRAVDTNAIMAPATSPSIAVFSDGRIGFAFRGTNGHLWVGQNGPSSGVDTGGSTLGATSPSVTALTNGALAVAFQGVNRHLWFGTGLAETDTNAAMAPGTSPSIAQMNGGKIAIAFQGVNGHLWFSPDGPTHGTDTGLVMKAGTSPAVLANGIIDASNVVFQNSAGRLIVFGNGTAIDSGINMSNGRSPVIVPHNFPFVAGGRGSNGNLWTFELSRDPQTQDEGMPMN